MAKSSLKGHTGFGVFSTRDINKGQPILSGPPGTPDGPTVAVVDSTRNVPLQLLAANHQWHNTWGHYWWGRGVPDHVAYERYVLETLQHMCCLGLPQLTFSFLAVTNLMPLIFKLHLDHCPIISVYYNPSTMCFPSHRTMIPC